MARTMAMRREVGARDGCANRATIARAVSTANAWDPFAPLRASRISRANAAERSVRVESHSESSLAVAVGVGGSANGTDMGKHYKKLRCTTR